jgi:hypothetical protein
MQISTDVALKGPVWAEMLDRLVDEVFDTNWAVYSLCISIGMMYDKQIASDDMVPSDYSDNPRYIPRLVLNSSKNKPLLEFMLQAALVTTKHVDYLEQERLEYAFSEKSDIPFKPMVFLTQYANYGVTKLKEALADSADVELLEALSNFLTTIYEAGYDPTADLELEFDDLY